MRLSEVGVDATAYQPLQLHDLRGITGDFPQRWWCPWLHAQHRLHVQHRLRSTHPQHQCYTTFKHTCIMFSGKRRMISAVVDMLTTLGLALWNSSTEERSAGSRAASSRCVCERVCVWGGGMGTGVCVCVEARGVVALWNSRTEERSAGSRAARSRCVCSGVYASVCEGVYGGRRPH